MNRPTLQVENLRTHFFTRQGVVKAVEDVSFAVGQGKMKYLEAEHGAAALNVMRVIKHALDPDDFSRLVKWGK